MQETIREVRWKQGSRCKGSAEATYKRLEKVRKWSGGVLSAGATLEDARKPSSPLHKQFQWDDSIAAEEYRMDQARYLIRSIEVVYEAAPNVPAQRVYVSTTQPETRGEQERKVFRTVEETLKDPVARDELLGNAIRDALTFRKKYHMLSELGMIFKALDEFVENSKIA